MPVPKYPTQEGRIEDYEVLGQEEGEEQQEAPPSEHPQKDQLPYGVHRSRMLDLHPATQASRELPVYVKYQKIRSRVQTEIKHIYGDVEVRRSHVPFSPRSLHPSQSLSCLRPTM